MLMELTAAWRCSSDTPFRPKIENHNCTEVKTTVNAVGEKNPEVNELKQHQDTSK